MRRDITFPTGTVTARRSTSRQSSWPAFGGLERYFPLRIERYEALADSGGAGKFRGGNGILMSYRFLAAGTVSIHDDRWFTYPWGVNGGRPGARARKIQRFLSQPFHVAEVFTGSPGKYVSLAETIRGFKMIVAGECDHLPEQAFYMVGTIDEAFEKAKKMA